jgi:predicted GNAT family acetyltransferase
MAGVVRRTHHGVAIAGIYTLPALRSRGYASAVTAALVDNVFAEGSTMVQAAVPLLALSETPRRG